MMVVLALKLTRMDSLKRLHMKDNHQLFYSGCHLPATVVIFYLGFNSFFQLFCFFCLFILFNCLMSILPKKGEIILS